MINLKKDLNGYQRQINDLEQYGRRWNLKIYNVQDDRKETARDTKDKALKVFNETMGLKVTPQNIEACTGCQMMTVLKRGLLL